MSRQVYDEDHISKIDSFLCKAYNKFKGGYVKTSIIAIAKTAQVVRPSETVTATKNLGIIKQTGERKGSMYYWPGNPPDIDTAEKVYREIKRMDTNDNLKKIAEKSAKSKNLIPIVGSVRPVKLKENQSITKARVSEIIEDMITNKGSLFMLSTLADEYSVDEVFFTPLIELDVIQPYNRIGGGFYKLMPINDNKSVVIDMVFDFYTEKKSPLREKSVDERSQQVFDFLKSIDRNPHKGSMVNVLKKRGLAAVYQTIAMRLGYIINTGNNRKPVYQLVGMPNMSMAQEIVAGVRDYWSKGDQKKTPIPLEQHQEVQPSVIPNEGDLNDMLDRAIKRKAFLSAEMEKIDKIIANAEAIKKLTAELI